MDGRSVYSIGHERNTRKERCSDTPKDINARELESVIDCYVLSREARIVMRLLLVDDLTQEKAAEEAGISPRKVWELNKKWLPVISRHI